MLGISAKAGKIISGTDYCIEEMKKGTVKLVLVAEDASEKTKKNFTYYARTVSNENTYLWKNRRYQ